jgi:hypothetical protein
MAISDRLKAAIEAVVKRIVGRYDYAAAYGYKVACQHDDDSSVDLMPDESTKIPPLFRVPILYGNPAEKVKVKAGAMCTVMFADCDPSKPFVFGWEYGSFESVSYGDGDRPIARKGDSVTIYYGEKMQFTGVVSGAPATGFLTPATSFFAPDIEFVGTGVIADGSDKAVA